jgi:hypothetical protein
MPTKNATLYDNDFYAWANELAALLRAGQLSELDVENIAEEMESIARREKRELVDMFSVLLLLLLRWHHQPGFRGRPWQLDIEQQRLRVSDHVSENPSLASRLDEIMANAYRRARLRAEHETGLVRTSFHTACPFTFDEAMNPDFWPD